MENIDMPNHIQNEIRLYIKQTFQTKSNQAEFSQLFEMLAPSKKRLILRDIFLVVFRKSTLFQDFLVWMKKME